MHILAAGVVPCQEAEAASHGTHRPIAAVLRHILDGAPSYGVRAVVVGAAGVEEEEVRDEFATVQCHLVLARFAAGRMLVAALRAA